ncbi:rust resistance kinase Lr10-like [Rhododendron vialii]|uniref:rust resistance kinase Lr10-like n=1 Tax=Rhododendron vialii TaxID=182163 RepID=UPI00265DF5BB|nr:rust resistance kinase Lr10-like [Rhododendron vialii]
MAIFLILLLFFLLPAGIGAGARERDRDRDDECMPKRCGVEGPEIRFPFWLKDHQPERCGYGPGFALTCSHNKKTMVDVAFSARAVVELIDYYQQYISYEFSGCVPPHEKNQSSITNTSPFTQTSSGDGYHVFSCPNQLAVPISSILLEDYYYYYQQSYVPLPCVSRPGHNLYLLYSDFRISQTLLNCTKMYGLQSDPMPYRTSWSQPHCWICEVRGKYCRLISSSNNSNKHETECFDIPKQPPRGEAPKKETKNPLAKGLIPPGLFLLGVLVIATYFIRRSKNRSIKKEDQVKVERFLENYRVLKPTRYTYAEIKKITRNFKDKLGQGGYGTVYKGEFSDGVPIAAKILNNFTGNGDDFINEVGTIGTIHHINVVRLVGYCADGYEKALVYEYLPNDSLEKYISSHRYRCLLGWEKLQDIAIGIAKGIEYLHQGCDQTILHFDIKPHNILLDKKLIPKISDFGLAKLCSKEQSFVSMTATRGTVGYIAPEVFSRNFGRVSHKSDVYSFGMLLLEIVGGRNKNVDDHTEENSDEAYFPEWIYKRLNHEAAKDNGVEVGRDAKIIKKLTIVGLWCIQWCPGGRPSMEAVVQMLEGNGKALAMPPNPFSTTNPSVTRGSVDGRPFSSVLDIISESESD